MIKISLADIFAKYLKSISVKAAAISELRNNSKSLVPVCGALSVGAGESGAVGAVNSFGDLGVAAEDVAPIFDTYNSDTSTHVCASVVFIVTVTFG